MRCNMKEKKPNLILMYLCNERNYKFIKVRIINAGETKKCITIIMIVIKKFQRIDIVLQLIIQEVSLKLLGEKTLKL